MWVLRYLVSFFVIWKTKTKYENVYEYERKRNADLEIPDLFLYNEKRN